MTDELHSGLHLHLFVQMRTNVRQPQKYSLPLSILNRIVLLSQGLCPRIPTNFCVQKFDKNFCFCRLLIQFFLDSASIRQQLGQALTVIFCNCVAIFLQTGNQNVQIVQQILTI